MKKQLVLAAVLLFVTCPSFASPGSRPDRNPSILDRLIFGSSIEDEIVKQSNKVKSQNEKYENTPEDKKEGFLFFKKSLKDKVLKELNRQKEILKDLLASTPSDAEAKKSELVDKDAEGPENANAEAVEVKFAMENLKNMVLQGRDELKTDPSNLKKARKYYDAHAVCLEIITEMNDEFTRNIDTIYLPSLDDLIDELEVLKKETERTLQTGLQDSQLRQTTMQIKANQEKILTALREIRAVRMPALKQWAQNYRPVLLERLSVARLASRTLSITEKAQVLVKDFGSDYQQIEFAPPPLIVFEVDLSKLELPR